MKKISEICIFGFNDLDAKDQSLIKEFIMHLDYYDNKEKTNINKFIGQIEIESSEIYIYFYGSPERNQLEIVIGILNYLLNRYQFKGNYTFYELSKYNLQYE
jgi:hypothetical protein